MNKNYTGVEKHFKYDPSNGKITSKGKEVGWVEQGYIRVMYKGKMLSAHRVALKILGIDIPDGYVIDHINGVGTDNRRDNLRVVTQGENQRNRACHRNGQFPGVQKRGNRYRARIRLDQKTLKSLGTYSSPEEAYVVYLKARKNYFGEGV